MNQFEHFLTIENFELAFKRLQTSPRNIYKDIYFEDTKIFGLLLKNNIESLIYEIKQRIYKPQKSHKIFIPKKNNLVRPLSLLHFRDLLVYQSIINIIADSVYDTIAPYYNNILFGNAYWTSEASYENSKFFLKPWKKQWKNFETATKKHYENGYNYLSEFDIASFFDTIDHRILEQILLYSYQIDDSLSKLLLQILESCTADSNYKTFKRKNGIPQGPIGSSFLADLYLIHLDLEFAKNRLDVKYIRYVDDIRIFSKSGLVGRKAIAYLDLLTRDIGLIPQSGKINVTKITNIEQVIKHQKSKLSIINREFKKRKGSLKSKTHKKLKKRLIDCFRKDSNENYLDKTIIKFAFYKLNKDSEVKNIILQECQELYIHYEAFLYYLKRHFYEDNDVRRWLIQILNQDEILFHHAIALILKYFPDISFSQKLYDKYSNKKHRAWLIKYFMIFWLYKNRKQELIFFKTTDENYFISRELNKINYYEYKDRDCQIGFIKQLLENDNTLINLQGIYLDFYNISLDAINLYKSLECNNHVKTILTKQRTDYVNHILNKYFFINCSQLFFNKIIWNSDKLYKELCAAFTTFYEFKDIDASKSLLNLNSFNELIFDKICESLKISKSCNNYGANLKSGCIQSCFPLTTYYFTLINDKRNQKTEAHVYDKLGNIRVMINSQELKKLISYEIEALKEICSYDFNIKR